jgi:hypothetical protein
LSVFTAKLSRLWGVDAVQTDSGTADSEGVAVDNAEGAGDVGKQRSGYRYHRQEDEEPQHQPKAL